MTLDFAETADDATLIHTLRPLVDSTLWHDGLTWWAQTQGTWTKAKFPTIWPHLHAAGRQLPDTPYWARSKHRLAMSHSARQIAFQLAIDCWTNQWPSPLAS